EAFDVSDDRVSESNEFEPAINAIASAPCARDLLNVLLSNALLLGGHSELPECDRPPTETFSYVALVCMQLARPCLQKGTCDHRKLLRYRAYDWVVAFLDPVSFPEPVCELRDETH